MANKYRSYRASLLPTGSDILGPFYRPGSPWRTRLTDKPTLFLTGTVKDTEGKPLDCLLDFWQADENGVYDESGPGFRGIQEVKNGKYLLETVKPGYYDISDPASPLPHDFRCSHIHAKIWIDGVDVLTTQLYFADSLYDDTDHWFSKDRCVTGQGWAIFDFVLATKGPR